MKSLIVAAEHAQHLLEGAPLFYGDFGSVEDVEEEFETSLTGYEILIASYECDSYEGDAWLLLRNTETREYWEVNASHCSCYGLEGQFNPELCDLDGLRHRHTYGTVHDSSEVKTALTNFFAAVDSSAQ